jgi:hypothetical protein
MATAVHTTTAHTGPMRTGKDARDARKRARIKISLPAEVRPFDARFTEIVDVAEVVDFTRDGIYFATCMPHYFLGMRLLVTFPFGKKVSTHKKFLGSIVRRENRPDGSVGIAVKFVL